jgi:hypothetical protein
MAFRRVRPGQRFALAAHHLRSLISAMRGRRFPGEGRTVKRLWLLALAIPLIFVSAGRAEAVACSDASIGGTYAGLITAGSCTIGDKTFSGFALLGDLDADEVEFAVIENGTNFGFSFQFSLVAFAGQSQDIALIYNVAVTNGTPLITDVQVVQTSSVSGDAFASVGETVCIGSIFPCTNAEQLNTFDFAGTANDKLTDRIDFDPVSIVGLRKDFVVAANGDCDTVEECRINVASMSLVDNTVSQTVPEPATVLLLGSGLLGLATWGRRKFRK